MENDVIMIPKEDPSIVVKEGSYQQSFEEKTVEVIKVSDSEPIVVKTQEAFPALGPVNAESNHGALYGRSAANQHPIDAITGLRQELDKIQSLQTIYSDKKQHADYYTWGETWDDEKNTPGHGYFVRLGFVEVEDGKYEERIYKCDGEETEVQTSLPLETKEIVIDDSDAWSEAGKITAKIYYVAETKTYYNYEVGAWVPYTEEEYEEIALDKIVVKYSYAGDIKTKDVSKYYIVGGFNNATKQWMEPCDIYAYNGMEYVKKSSYGYKNGGVYKNALMDVLGVTVPSYMAGFIGNQSNKPKNNEIQYALVATAGVVDVLCDHDVVVGDYVQPYAYGWAKKSTGSYGYLVTALVQNDKIVSSAGDDLLYARIILEPSIALNKKLSNNVDSLLEATRRLDANIISFGNTASQAYSMSDRALKLAEDCATDSQAKLDDVNRYVQDVATSAGNAWDKAYSAEQLASKAEEISAQAKKDAAEAKEYTNTEIPKIISDSNNALALAITTNNALRALEYRLDDYSVGRYSQAYGLTWSQAKAILPTNETREDGNVHSIVFIPMNEDPLSNEECIYTEVYSTIPTASVSNGYWKLDDVVTSVKAPENAATPIITRSDGENKTWLIDGADSGMPATDDITKEFIVSYSYVWTNDGWDGGTQNVSFSNIEPVRYDGVYWYVPKTYDGAGFKKESLYRYENGGWMHVATRDENVMGRTVAYINHTKESITQSVTGIQGQVSAIQTKVDKEGAKTSMWASVPTELEGKKPVNYYETGEAPEVVENFATFTSTSEINVAIAKSHLDSKTDLYYDKKYNCIYYCIGKTLPYQVYRAELVDDKVVFTEELAVAFDGVDLYRVNAASIVASVNEDGDSNLQFDASRIHFTADDYSIFAENILLSADNILMDGEVIFIQPGDLGEGGTTSIDGANIKTGTISADRLDLTGTLSVSAKSNLVASVEVSYARSSLATEFIKTTEWSTTAPTWVEGEYMWQKTITTYADHTTEKPHAIETTTCIQGARGAVGNSLQVKYINSNTTPVITNNDVSGWDDQIPTVENGKKTYMTQKMSNETNWSTPVQISAEDGSTPTITISNGYWVINGEVSTVKAKGEDGNTPNITVGDNGNWYVDSQDSGQKAQGEAGKDGSCVEYVYYRSQTQQTNLEAPEYTSGTLPSGWTPSPQGITDEWKYEYMSARTKAAGTDVAWSSFSPPVIWSKWGEKGHDGDGVEYKYCLINSDTKPEYPTPTGETYQWEDDPQGVSEQNKYEYVVQIKKTTVDGELTLTPSEVALWAKWSSDGGTPYIGSNGNWFVGNTDLGVKAEGADGTTPTIEINADGYWVINNQVTTVKAVGSAGIYIKTIIDQYYLSTSVTKPIGTAKTIKVNNEEIKVGQWVDIVDNSKLPIVKIKNDDGSTTTYYRFRRQQYIWSDHIDGKNEGEDGYHITSSAVRLDETDQRILDWCSATNSTFIDGGSIYAKSITTRELATDAIQSVGDSDGNGEYEYVEGDIYSKSGSKFDLANGNIITPKFSVIDGEAHISGYITATGGEIGGYLIDETSLISGAVGMNSDTTQGAYAFWAGNVEPDKAGFSVTNTGRVCAIDGKIGGFDISGADLIGTGNNGSLILNPEGLTLGRPGVRYCQMSFDGTNTMISTPIGDTMFSCGNDGETYFLLSTEGDTSVPIHFVLQIQRYKGITHDNKYNDYEYCYKYRVASDVSRKGKTLIKVIFQTSSSQAFYNPTEIEYTFTISSGLQISEWWTSGPYEAYGILDTTYLRVKFDQDESWSAIYNLDDTTIFPINALGGNDLSGDDNKFVAGTKGLKITQRSMSNGDTTGVVSFHTNLLPTDDNTYNLGGYGSAWKNLYLSGDAYNSSGSAIDLSDANRKNTIDPLTDKYSQFFDSLSPVTYKYNSGTSDRLHAGFIAQDVKLAIESAGLTMQDFAGYCEWEDSDGNITCGLRYSEFIALCVREIQKLKKQVEELKKQYKMIPFE